MIRGVQGVMSAGADRLGAVVDAKIPTGLARVSRATQLPLNLAVCAVMSNLLTVALSSAIYGSSVLL